MARIRPPQPRNTKHGYMSFPKSRAVVCRDEGMGGAIQWEPQSVEAPKGWPHADDSPPDGRLASGGKKEFSVLDGVLDPKGRLWPATQVPSGGLVQWNWWLTAPHKTTGFRYYCTKTGWDQHTKLTRAHFDLEPFLTVNWDDSAPAQAVSHWGRLPAKTGRHAVYCVWTIADTAMAFYQMVDVDLVPRVGA